MQIKTTMRYFTPMRMATKKVDSNKCWQGCGDIRTYTLLVEM